MTGYFALRYTGPLSSSTTKGLGRYTGVTANLPIKLIAGKG